MSMKNHAHEALTLFLTGYGHSNVADELATLLLAKHGPVIVNWTRGKVLLAAARAVEAKDRLVGLKGMERADAQRDNMLAAMRMRDVADVNDEITLLASTCNKRQSDGFPMAVVLMRAGAVKPESMGPYAARFFADVEQEAGRQLAEEKAAALEAAWCQVAPSPARARL